MSDKLILLTNDDGIQSPGLWEAANALAEIGTVQVVAPKQQSTGAGRSMSQDSTGIISNLSVTIRGERWNAFAVEGSPAQAVRHALLELLEKTPDLVVSGINYGENIGTCVTISGTVGAAIEGAANGVPSMAVSLQMHEDYNFSHSPDIDFSAAAFFTNRFAAMMMEMGKLKDIDILKIDVPLHATRTTPWELTRISRQPYYLPVKPERDTLHGPGPIRYRIDFDRENLGEDTDIYALRVAHKVSVTPVSINMTSRVNLSEVEKKLHGIFESG